MKTTLIHIQPYDKLTGTRIDARLGDSDVAGDYGLGGIEWEPAIKDRPTITMDLCSPDLDGKVLVGRATFSVMLNKLQNIGDITRLVWRGAPLIIYTADNATYSSAFPEFVGRIATLGIDRNTGIMTINAAVSTNLIEKPILWDEFTGAGGLNGDAGLRGTPRPAGFGLCENIPPVWFDLTDNIGQIDGYGNTVSITRLMEGASDLGPRVNNFANYTALKNAIITGVVKEGQWATCVASGLVGLGGKPKGVIGVNAYFNGDRTGSLSKRLILSHAKVAAGLVDTAAFDALDVAVPRPVHYWTAGQRQVKDLLEALAGAANATPLIGPQGLITITRGVTSTAVATLDASGSSDPRVLDWKSLQLDPPYYQLKARAARPANVLTTDQVFYEDDIVDRGTYDPAVTYYQGNKVYGENGAAYLYTNATPSAGQPLPVPPAESTAYWQQVQQPILPEYSDGTSIDDLRPGEAGANITENRTASAIDGQGSLATRGNVYFGSSYLLESNGGAGATLAGFKTIQGTAAAITGQGWGATAAQARADNLYVPLGQNRFVNSSFARGAYGIRTSPTSTDGKPATFGINLSTGYFGIRNVYGASLNGAWAIGSGTTYLDAFVSYGPWSGGTLDEGRQFGMPVALGDYVACTARLARHRSRSVLYLLVFNKAGALVQAPQWEAGRLSGGANGDPANFDLVGGISQITHADAAFAMLLVRMFPTGESEPYVFITEPFIAKVAASQISLPAYNDGPSDPVADRTNDNTAAGYTGQGPFSTIMSAGFGSSLLTGFKNLAGLDNVIFGSAQILESLGGPSATLNGFKTSLGTALGFIGQTPWATLINPTSLLTAENANLVINGGLRLGSNKWALGTGWSWQPGTNGEGAFLQRTAAGQSISYSDYFSWGPNLSGYSQAEMFAGGMTAGDFKYDIEFFNGTTQLSPSSGQFGPANGAGWSEVGGAFTSPANTTRARFRFFHGAGVVNTNSAIRRIKVSRAANRTKFTDEATYGARYDDGIVMESLKPGEIGSNVTENRVSSGFTGQAPWATFLGLVPTAVQGQVSRIQSDGYMQANAIYYVSGTTFAGFVNDLRPGEAGANVTEGRVAASVTGQGSLATKSSVAYGSTFVTGFGALAARGSVNMADGTVTNKFAENMVYGFNGIAMSDLRPDEAGSNKTESRTAAAILGQGFGATAAQGLVDNRRVAVGDNASVNSRFRRGMYAWEGAVQVTNGSPRTINRGVNLNSSYSGMRDVFYSQIGSGVWNDQGSTYADVLMQRGFWNGEGMATTKLYGLPVKQGDKLAASALIARHRCNTALFILICDANGALTEAPSWNGGREGGGNNGNPANFDRVGGVVTVNNANSAFAILMVRATPNGGSDPYVFATEMMLTKIPIDQTVLPEYKDGPEDPAGDATGGNTAAGILGQGAFATAPQISSGNVASYFSFSAFKLDYSITRSDGINVVTENLALTYLGISAGISGQGTGATANSLNDLDPVAQGQLNSLTAGNRRAYGYGDIARARLTNGQSIALEARVLVLAGGVSGTVRVRVDVSPSGANSWSTVGLGPTDTVGPGEAGASDVTATYTNASGVTKLFDFRVMETRAGASAGGAIDRTETYLLA